MNNCLNGTNIKYKKLDAFRIKQIPHVKNIFFSLKFKDNHSSFTEALRNYRRISRQVCPVLIIQDKFHRNAASGQRQETQKYFVTSSIDQLVNVSQLVRHRFVPLSTHSESIISARYSMVSYNIG